jgi:hypothetical protein
VISIAFGLGAGWLGWKSLRSREPARRR